MAVKIVKLVQPADPTIDQVFEEFLAEQHERLKPRTVSRYEDVLNLLRHHLNGYACETLSNAESALFDRHYNANGDEHREFCELFGPDKIVGSLGSFLGYFMIRKVMAGQDLKRAAGSFQSTGRKPGGMLTQGVRRLAPAALTRRIHPAESVTDPRETPSIPP